MSYRDGSDAERESFREYRERIAHGEHGRNTEDGGPSCHGGPGTIAQCEATADRIETYFDGASGSMRPIGEFLSAHVQVIAVAIPGALYATADGRRAADPFDIAPEGI